MIRVTPAIGFCKLFASVSVTVRIHGFPTAFNQFFTLPATFGFQLTFRASTRIEITKAEDLTCKPATRCMSSLTCILVPTQWLLRKHAVECIQTVVSSCRVYYFCRILSMLLRRSETKVEITCQETDIME